MPTNINGNTGIDKVQDGTVVSADIATLDASKLTGTVAPARLGSGSAGSGNFLRGDGSWQTAGSTSASDLTSGTLADARFPSTLPAASAANLTAIPAANITGTLPAINGASLTGVGISGVDTWVLSTGFTGNADPLTTNLRRDNTSANSLIGTGMALDTSTGLWTFPATGYWQVSAYVTYKVTATDVRYCVIEMDYTANNGTSFTTPSLGRASIANMSSVTYTSHNNTKIFDITDTSNQKVRFSIFKAVSGVETVGNATENETYFTFIKLGDT